MLYSPYTRIRTISKSGITGEHCIKQNNDRPRVTLDKYDFRTQEHTYPSFMEQTSSINIARSARDECDTHFSTTLLQ